MPDEYNIRDSGTDFWGNDVYTASGHGNTYDVRQQGQDLFGNDVYKVTQTGSSKPSGSDEAIGGLIGIVLLILAAVAVGILLAPLYFGPKWARALGWPWDAVSMTVILYLLYVVAGCAFAVDVLADQSGAVSVGSMALSLPQCGQIMFAALLLVGCILAWKLAQVVSRQGGLWDVPRLAPSLVLVPVAVGLFLRAVVWAVTFVTWGHAYSYALFESATWTNWIATQFLGQWDVARVLNWFPSLFTGHGEDFWHLRSAWFALSDIVAALVCLGFAYRLYPWRPWDRFVRNRP